MHSIPHLDTDVVIVFINGVPTIDHSTPFTDSAQRRLGPGRVPGPTPLHPTVLSVEGVLLRREGPRFFLFAFLPDFSKASSGQPSLRVVLRRGTRGLSAELTSPFLRACTANRGKSSGIKDDVNQPKQTHAPPQVTLSALFFLAALLMPSPPDTLSGRLEQLSFLFPSALRWWFSGASLSGRLEGVWLHDQRSVMPLKD